MNAPHDDDSFDEYLQRGTAVSQQYRALGEDDVPKELDDRVLAEAARATERSVQRTRSWRRWTVPVTLAASTVLAVSIVLESGVHREAVTMRGPASTAPEATLQRQSPAERPAEREDAPVVAPPASASQKAVERNIATESVVMQPPPTAAVSADSSAEFGAEDARKRSRVSTDRAAAASERLEPPEQQFAPAPPVDRRESAANAPMRAMTQPAGPPLASSAASGEAAAEMSMEPLQQSSTERHSFEAASASEHEAQDALDWLERIREMRQTGQIEAADRQWQAFRRAFPAFHVEDGDRARPGEGADRLESETP